MDIKIRVSVDSACGKKVVIKITDADIEEIAEAKAQAQGIKPRQGKVFTHYSPSIEAVECNF